MRSYFIFAKFSNCNGALPPSVVSGRAGTGPALKGGAGADKQSNLFARGVTNNMYRWRTATIGILALACGTVGTAQGETITAADTSQTEVQNAVNRASDGDTVVIPKGSSTWKTKVSVLNKSITLQGSGIGLTVITSGITTLFHNAPLFVDATGKAVRVTGFTFIGGPGDGEGFVEIISSSGFRVDHCDFQNLTKRGLEAYATATSYGVVDHCTFTKLSGTPQGVSVFGDGDAAWNRPLGLGVEEAAVYVEDCTFTWPSSGDSCVDIYSGGRLVFRHNVVTNCNIGSHGLDSGAYRSAVSWEIYDNTSTVTTTLSRQFFFRGGTGVVYDNHITSSYGSISNNIEVTCYRATGTLIGDTTYSMYLPWGHVTGSNPYDGNTDSYGWPALDQIGACPLTTPSDILSKAPDNHSVQGRSAAYAWGNTLNGDRMPMGTSQYSGNGYPSGKPGDPNVDSLIKENRDFFNDKPKPGYTALVYPHPLVGTDSNAIAQPKGLSISSP